MLDGLRSLAPGVDVLDGRQRFAGLEMGARMTILRLDGGLLVYSPLGVDPAGWSELGEARWVIAPNLFHHLYVGPWLEAGLEGWAAPKLPDKRSDLSFHGVVESGSGVFGPQVEVMTMRCFSMTNEVVLLHRPSRTLVVTDLVFNIAATAPWLTRAAMWCMCGYPGCRTTLLERIGFDRAVAREELATIAGWDFDRIIMAHGEVIETNGKRALLDAFAWLGLRSLGPA